MDAGRDYWAINTTHLHGHYVVLGAKMRTRTYGLIVGKGGNADVNASLSPEMHRRDAIQQLRRVCFFFHAETMLDLLHFSVVVLLIAKSNRDRQPDGVA